MVQTQQIEDEGFNGDDVEIALENSKYDTEKVLFFDILKAVTICELCNIHFCIGAGYSYSNIVFSQAVSYLELVNKWKELGFPPQKIHDALKNTDRENENVFEYLTR